MKAHKNKQKDRIAATLAGGVGAGYGKALVGCLGFKSEARIALFMARHPRACVPSDSLPRLREVARWNQ